jgi:hypothetical protein
MGCGSGKITYVIGFQNSIYGGRQPQNAIWASFSFDIDWEGGTARGRGGFKFDLHDLVKYIFWWVFLQNM